MQRCAFAWMVNLVLVAALWATPALAEEICVGSENLAGACVEPSGGPIYEDCIYVGEPECVPVSVPGPELTRYWPTVGCILKPQNC